MHYIILNNEYLTLNLEKAEDNFISNIDATFHQ